MVEISRVNVINRHNAKYTAQTEQKTIHNRKRHFAPAQYLNYLNYLKQFLIQINFWA